MPRIIGVKFRDTGRVYYFDPADEPFRYHDHVIVETSRGPEYGTVVISPTDVAEDRAPSEIRKVIRRATADDDAHLAELQEKEKEAYRICKEKIAEHALEMKLIKAEYAFDNSKVLFYFTADGRIDFRELVKDLAGVFRTRIELRQIGVRDETKLLGGIGTCGRPLCCHTWLTEFAPVSIKMAKDQNLSLNPSKISGTCGRLMCCLKNEADTYAYLHKGMPGKGDYATTPDGQHGDVHSVDILRQKVRVIVELDNDEKELQEFDAKDITFIPRSKKPKKDQNQGSKKDQNQGPKKDQNTGLKKDQNQEQSGRKNRTDLTAKTVPEEEPAGDGRSIERDAAPEPQEGGSESRKRSGRERTRRQGRHERTDRAAYAERAEESDGTEHLRKPERGDRTERPKRPERTGRTERPARPERTGRPENRERTDRDGKNVRAERPGETETAEGTAAQDAEHRHRRRRRRRRNPGAEDGGRVMTESRPND